HGIGDAAGKELDLQGTWTDPAPVAEVRFGIGGGEFEHGDSKARPIAIAPRVLAVPVPGRLDNAPQLAIPRLPAQLAAHLVGGGHQCRRIARPARPFLHRHRLARDFLHATNDFADAVAPAGAQVVAQALPRLQALQSYEVRLGEIVHVDIIADA